MNNIQKKLETLLHYYMSSRQSGHTTLMKEGINHYDKPFFVLTYNMNHGSDLNLSPKDVVSWTNLDKLQGHHRPMAIDNAVITELLADALMRIEALEEENKKLTKQNKLIIVKSYED